MEGDAVVSTDIFPGENGAGRIKEDQEWNLEVLYI